MIDSVFSVFHDYRKYHCKAEAAHYLWLNVKLMQEKNKPYKGSPSRDIMPQTDQAVDWKKSAFNTQKFIK